jgi:hypothetical protein
LILAAPMALVRPGSTTTSWPSSFNPSAIQKALQLASTPIFNRSRFANAFRIASTLFANLPALTVFRSPSTM